MHRPLRHWTLVLMFLPLSGAPLLPAQEKKSSEKSAPPPALVVVAPVVEHEVHSGQMFVGTTVPLKVAVVGSAVDGRVAEFPINEGDRVTKGQALVQLLTETIRLEHEAAVGELKLREEKVNELKAGARKEELEQARAKMEADQAMSTLSKSQYDRSRSLFDQGRAISPSDLEAAAAAYRNAEQMSLFSKAAYEMAKAGPRPEVIAQAEAQLASQVATTNRLSDMVKKHTIISPFNGYVVAEHTEVGEWVNRGQHVATVAFLDEIEIKTNVLEDYIPYVEQGETVRVEIPAIANKVFTGTVSLIVPQADERARTFPVKIRVKNVITEKGPLIKAGMLARVTLSTGANEMALLVPKDAIVLGGASPMIYLVDGAVQGKDKEEVRAESISGKAKPVPVRLGIAHGELIQVLGQVQTNQWVVVQGNERIAPDQPLTVTRIIQPELGQVDDAPLANGENKPSG